MVVKKYISIIFLLLSAVLLLIHAILPHCHHKDVVHILALSDLDACCEQGRCATESDSDNHEHDCLYDCVLKTIIARDNNTHDSHTCVCHICNSLLFTYVLDIWQIEFVDVNHFSLPKPYIESLYTSYTSLPQGLRAPPFIA